MGINELNNKARVRHTAFMQYVLQQVGIKNNTGKPFKLVTRVGSARSADGIVFDIGKGKVAKFMFVGKGAISNIDVVKKEYKIAKLMSDAGAGPRVYGMVEFKLPKTLLNLKNNLGSKIKNWPKNANMIRNLANNLKKQGYNPATNIAKGEIIHPYGPRVRSFNLFQNWYANHNMGYNSVLQGGVIFMENLYKGPAIKKTVPLYEYVTQLKKPYPLKELAAAVKKMHSINIAHQDLHARNILVQMKKNGSIRVVIIDFGRAKHPAVKRNMNGNWWTVQGFAQFAKVNKARFESAFGKMPRFSSSSTTGGAAPARLTLSSSKVMPRPSKTALSVPIGAPASIGLMKAASGGYRIKGKRGPKKVNLTLAQLRQYAFNKGAAVPLGWKKKQILNFLYAQFGKGSVPVAAPKPAALSYGLVFNKGSVRMRGKKGLIKPTKLTVAQLKAYAAKKGINLMGAKLKKNILQKLAK